MIEESLKDFIGAIVQGGVGDGDRTGGASGMAEGREGLNSGLVLGEELLSSVYFGLEAVDGVLGVSGVVVDHGIVDGDGVVGSLMNIASR